MKQCILKSLFIFLTSIFSIIGFSQVDFTPYDDLPGVIKSYKPSYAEDLPSWGKMLYQSPVNFNEITREFKIYMDQHTGEKTAIIRYFKIWSRACESYVLPDGTILLPDMDEYNENLRKTQLKGGMKARNAPASNSDWTFLGPMETFWLNES